MSPPSETRASPVDVASILRDGTYYVLDEFALRETMYAKIVETFLDGVEALASRESRRALERAGLRKLHEWFPVTKIRLLEDYFLKRLREDLYYWSFAVGRDTLRLAPPFYIDYLIVVRIHYPFLSVRSQREIVEAPFPVRERVRFAVASLRNAGLLLHRVGTAFRKRRARREKAIAYDAAAYHGELATPARAHGPHLDTWYGHSYDGLNLWWSIDGVNVDNTVILYPEMFGRPVAYDPRSMYVAAGVPLSKPRHVDMGPGQLLIFNPEVLHGTQVNISDDTRVALTTRVNPGPPRFNDAAPFNFEHWFVSSDVARRRFGALRVFPSHIFRGEPSVRERGPLDDARTIRAAIRDRLRGDAAIKVCAVEYLKPGHKLVLDLENAKLVLWRGAEGAVAFRRTCPHLGIDIADGYHDGERVFCPGHGLAFRWADGSSRCTAFRLRPVDAFERGGYVYVRARGADTG